MEKSKIDIFFRGGVSINGDYAGFAQIELEELFPGCVVMNLSNKPTAQSNPVDGWIRRTM